MNKVMVKIHGAEYPMVGDKPEQHMIKVAEFVDEEMNKVTQNNPRLSLSVAAIVTSLNITDLLFECSKENDELSELNGELKKKVGTSDDGLKLELRKIKLLLDNKEKEALENKAKLEELNNIIQAQKEEIDKLGNKTEGSKEEIDSYKAKIEELTIEVQQANERADIAESLSSEFQNKAYGVQLKYTELENELKYLRAKTL